MRLGWVGEYGLMVDSDKELFFELDDVFRHVFSQVRIFEKQSGFFTKFETGVFGSNIFWSV